MIKNLPRVEVVGPYRDMEAQTLIDLDYLDKIRTVGRYGLEVTQAPERMAQLTSITSATEDFLSDVGVRLPQERIPVVSRFHYFNSAHDMRLAAGYSDDDSRYGKAHGLCDYHNILVADSEEDFTLQASQHEAIHFMAYQAWRPTPVRPKRSFGIRGKPIYIPMPVRSGYLHASPKPNEPAHFDLLQELFIEMTTIYINQNYWRRYENLPTSNLLKPGYFRLLMIGEEMIDTTARNLNMGRKEVFLPIAKGLFSGEMDGMRLLSRGLGTDAFRAAVHASPLDASPELAIRMGVAKANERISQAVPTKPVEAFGWMSQ